MISDSLRIEENRKWISDFLTWNSALSLFPHPADQNSSWLFSWAFRLMTFFCPRTLWFGNAAYLKLIRSAKCPLRVLLLSPKPFVVSVVFWVTFSWYPFLLQFALLHTVLIHRSLVHCQFSSEGQKIETDIFSYWELSCCLMSILSWNWEYNYLCPWFLAWGVLLLMTIALRS